MHAKWCVACEVFILSFIIRSVTTDKLKSWEPTNLLSPSIGFAYTNFESLVQE